MNKSSFTNNSTTPLSGGATFTGTGEINDYEHVGVSCFSDTAGTLYFDFSPDGTNWSTFPTAGFTVAAKGKVFNRSVATTYEVLRVNVDTAVENTVILDDPVSFRLNPTDVLYFTASTDTNNTSITARFSLNEYQIS